MYVFLADTIAVLHLSYVLVVVVGLLLTLLGGALRWRWVRNRWWRMIHLAMIVGVVARAVLWPECPLSWWERDLRNLAGQVDFEGSYIGWVAHAAIHPHEFGVYLSPRVFLTAYSIFALLVALAFWLVPIRWRGGAEMVTTTDLAEATEAG